MPAAKPKTNSLSNANCILVSKSGSLKDIHLTNVEHSQEHYNKLCGTPPTYLKSFTHHATWVIKKFDISIELWGRTNGRAGQENKYEFPPPVDNHLFFGDCLLVSMDAEPLTSAIWKKVHAHLFGGFKDLTNPTIEKYDNDEIDELETVPSKKKTRDGYLKDGFIVDDGGLNIKHMLHKIKTISKSETHHVDDGCDGDNGDNGDDDDTDEDDDAADDAADVDVDDDDDDDDEDDEDEGDDTDADDDDDECDTRDNDANDGGNGDAVTTSDNNCKIKQMVMVSTLVKSKANANAKLKATLKPRRAQVATTAATATTPASGKGARKPQNHKNKNSHNNNNDIMNSRVNKIVSGSSDTASELSEELYDE
jgi:hypothetical protein